MNVLTTFAPIVGNAYLSSQRLPTNLGGVDQLQLDKIPAPDALSGFKDVSERFAQQRRNGRPITTASMPISMRALHPRLWDKQDWEAIQLMEQTRKTWAKEVFDGTRFEFVTGNFPYKRQPFLRDSMTGGWLPDRQNTMWADRYKKLLPLYGAETEIPDYDTRRQPQILETLVGQDPDREI